VQLFAGFRSFRNMGATLPFEPSPQAIRRQLAGRRVLIGRVPDLQRNLDCRLEPQNRVRLCLCHLWSKPTLTIIRSR
jgi:hypothetical protein